MGFNHVTPVSFKGISRRNFLKTAIQAAGAAACAPMLFPYPAAAKKRPLKIGYLPITDATPLLVAYSLGYFSHEGLHVERPVMVRSWNILSESFLTGKFDLAHMLFPIPVWMRFKQNIPVKVLAWNHTNGSAVTVRADSGINRFADLSGKQVAVPSWYSMHNLVMQLGLQVQGLEPVIRPPGSTLAPHEVNLFILSPPDMPQALLGKKIDAFIVADPFNALAQEKFSAKIMRYSGDIWKNHPCCVIVANDHLIQESPIVMQKAINAIVRAQAWCLKNPQETAHLLSRDGKGFLPVGESVLNRVFGAIPEKELIHPQWNVERIGFQPFPFSSATRFILEQMKKTKVEGNTDFLTHLDTNTAVSQLVDDRFVTKAMDDMGGMKEFCHCDMENVFTREEIVEIN
ncbi:ABC transporter substrate-binding protein [Desulfobacter latus]|uniref:ABC transporter substrate-binding protein n=1 Tax=Desulfobacter latus TaxID=2292 RepID=A0A850T6A8_9BACT|nr:ABC transporter substrate-binding protein [Desulfobacter latus]NWH06631.1 ABC transporter substrate-binding protein [Desulfobacter latus]